MTRRRRGSSVIGSPARMPAEQPQARPGVAAVEDPVRLGQAVGAGRHDPVADTFRPSVPTALDGGAERRDDPGRRPDVGAVAGAVDPALAGGERRQHQRPMADRLVAGQAQLAAQPRGRADARRPTSAALAGWRRGRAQCLASPPGRRSRAPRPARGDRRGATGPARGPARSRPSGRGTGRGRAAARRRRGPRPVADGPRP